MCNLAKIYIFGAATVLIACTALSISAEAHWKKIDSGTLAWLRSVFFVDEDVGWVVGASGTFLATTDGGKTWSRSNRVTVDNIRDVYFYDRTRGWLLCEYSQFEKGSRPASYFLKTIDGGLTWKRIDLNTSDARLVRMFFSKTGVGFAVGEGGAIWQLLDDGKTWKRRETPTRYLILDGQFVDDFNVVMVGGGATVLLSRDAGVEWTVSTLGSKGKLNSVFFLDRMGGWVAGSNGRLFSTDDGGSSWREHASGVSKDFFDIHFVNSREGYAIGDAGQVVRTVDGGVTWTQERTGVSGPLERVAIVGKLGIAVGYGGVILKYFQDK